MRSTDRVEGTHRAYGAPGHRPSVPTATVPGNTRSARDGDSTRARTGRLVSQPRLAGYIDMSFHVRNVHRSMLDQETGLRGWLATGDSTFLTPYTSGLEESETESDALLAALAAQDAPDLAEPVLEMLLARQVWEQWAMEAATRSFDATERDQLSDFLVVGKEHFDSYRVHVATSTDLIVSQRDEAVSSQRGALLLALLGNLVILLGMAVWLLHRRRVVRTRYVEPFDTLLQSIDDLRAGDLSVRTRPSGVREIDAIGDQLQSLAGDLAVARTEADARETRLARLAERFRVVVRVGREISGSLNVMCRSRSRRRRRTCSGSRPPCGCAARTVCSTPPRAAWTRTAPRRLPGWRRPRWSPLWRPRRR